MDETILNNDYNTLRWQEKILSYSLILQVIVTRYKSEH